MPSPPNFQRDIYQAAEEFRRAVAALERQASADLIRAYGETWLRIKQRLEELARDIEQATARGESPSVSWLVNQQRLEALMPQVAQELSRFAAAASDRLTSAQKQLIKDAEDYLREIEQQRAALLASGADLATAQPVANLPISALETLAGFTSTGTPLNALLNRLAGSGVESVRAELFAGLALGLHPDVIARRIRLALGGNLARAITISRTEIFRSYREASRRIYLSNSDIISGWVWLSAKTTRTCAFCWAMHGTFHSNDETMATHPRCRCAMVPKTKSWAELGFPGIEDTSPTIEPGPDLFRQLSKEDQAKILGPAKYEAYAKGEIGLEDLVGRRYVPGWGWTGFELSLAEARK